MSFYSLPKRTLSILGGSLLAATFALAPSGAAWAAPEPVVDYVALGDSYAVGLGLGPTVGSIPGCGQTAESYPRRLALELGLDLTDATCSGATTADVVTAPQAATGNPVQSSALSADTDIVTLTIGGNDLGFSRIIQTCLAAGPNGPLATAVTIPDCKTAFTGGGVDTLAAAVTGAVKPAVENTLATIKELAPNAKVFVVGYPALLPDAANTAPGGCFTPFTGERTAFPFTNVDVAYLHGIQAQLDSAMAATATAANATFVPLFASTLANTPCAGNPNAAIDGVYPGASAMHPNTLGATLMADQARGAVAAALTAPGIAPESSGIDVLAGTLASLTFTTSGFPQPVLTLDGQLPAGMAFDGATGVLSGTPVDTGTSTFSLTATNGVGTVTGQYSISVNEVPALTVAAPPGPATVGVPYSHTFTATGFPAPVLALTGELPAGLGFDAASGTISGTPTAAGSHPFTVTAVNKAGTAAALNYTLVVNASAVAPAGAGPAAVIPAAEVPAANAPSDQMLAATGAGPLLPMGAVGVLALLAGVGLLLARRTAKG